MKDGRTRLAHKLEQAVDMETGAVVATTVQTMDGGDTASLPPSGPRSFQAQRTRIRWGLSRAKVPGVHRGPLGSLAAGRHPTAPPSQPALPEAAAGAIRDHVVPDKEESR